MREKRENRINKWIDDVSNSVKLQAAGLAPNNTPEQHLTDQANWRPAGQDVTIDAEEQRWKNGVASFAFGEDAEVREDREGIRILIDKMIAQTDEIRSFERGKLEPGDCDGVKMLKRPFDNAENDFRPSKRARQNDTSPDQQLAEDATGDLMDVNDFGDQTSD